ncbi:hypothetical protein D3C85_993670 [compost metagenome]
MLCNRSRCQPHSLQAILIHIEMQGRGKRAPVGVHGSHHRTVLHHAPHLLSDHAQLCRVRPHHPVSHRKWRIRTKHNLRRPEARFRGEPLSDCFAKMQFEGFPCFLTLGQHHDLGERRIGQLRRHRQEETRRTLTDIGRDDFCLVLLAQPGLDLGSRGTGLLDGGAVGHLHLDHDLGTVRGREELFLHQVHARSRHEEQRDHRARDQPFARNDPSQNSAEAVVSRRVVDRRVSTLHGLDVWQQLHAQIRGESHRNDPGSDQCNAHDPEHVAGVLTGRGLSESVR